MSDQQQPPPIRILYHNHAGITRWRSIVPAAWRYGSSEWHPEPQWLLEALDTDKGEPRTFALNDIRIFLRAEVASVISCLDGEPEEARKRCDDPAELERYECPGYERGGTLDPCCERAGEYNGYGSGPLLFQCPKGCGCHD